MSDVSLPKSGLPQLRSALRRAAKDLRSTTRRAAWYSLAWRWLALLAVLFVLDLVFGMPVWLRWASLIGQAGFLLSGAYMAITKNSPWRLRVADDRAARVVEERHPELDNALINAVQFEQALAGADPAVAALMQREMARAEVTAANMSLADSVDRTAEIAALRRMAALLLVWAITGILFSGIFMAVMPRLFLPWMDSLTPPYSPTHFDVRPPGAVVRYGDSLTITVKLSGRMPDGASLMTQSQGKDWHRIAMDSEAQDSYSVKLDSLRDDTLFYVQASTGRSAQYKITVTRPPAIQSLHAVYTYLKYTAKPPATELVGQAGLHGLSGTAVVLQINANRDLSGGQLTIKTADGQSQTIPVEVSSKTNASATVPLTLIQPGEFHLSLTSGDGQINADAAHGKIVIEKDQNPSVWFTFPAQDLIVTPEMTVPLKLQAEDDNGVQTVQVHRIINDLSDSPHISQLSIPVKKVNETVEMDLKSLGVRPGDQITYRASAFDNAPGQPNMGESNTFTLRVVTAEEFAKALEEQRTAEDLHQETRDIATAVKQLAEQQAELAKEMERLKNELAKNPNDKALQKQMADAAKAQKDLQQQAQEMAKQMQEYSKSPSASDLERALKAKLAKLAQQLSAMASGAMQQGQSGNPSQAAEGAKSAAKQAESISSQMEAQVGKAIEHLAEILPLYNDMDRFMQLLDQQGQLVLKSREFQQTMGSSASEKARMQALANEQSRIAGDLKQLQQDMVQHAAAAEAHFPKAAASARRIAAEILTRNIPKSMDAGKDSFRQWDGPSGFANSQRALEQMQAMVSQCKGGQGEACNELDVSLSKSLGQSGLGKGLGQFSMKMGAGNAPGFGMGGMMSGQAGQGNGGTAVRSPKPFVPSAMAKSADGTGGSKKMQHANHIAGVPAGLSPQEVEVVKQAANAPHKAGDHEGSGYPAEYRKMVSDYFKSVAEHQ